MIPGLTLGVVMQNDLLDRVRKLLAKAEDESCPPAEAGADVFVAGSAVYDAQDPAAAAVALREQAERATVQAGWRQHP